MPKSTSDWVEAAPAALRERIRDSLASIGGATDSGDPERLAAAGLDRLRRVIESAGDRASAFDLLAADALLTEACGAAAENGPEGLAAFAQELIEAIAGLVPGTEGAEDLPMAAKP